MHNMNIIYSQSIMHTLLQYFKSSQQSIHQIYQSMHIVLARRVLYVVYESIMHNMHTTVRVVVCIIFHMHASNSGVLHTLEQQFILASYQLEYMHRLYLYIIYTLAPSILCTYIIYSSYESTLCILHKRHAKKQREQVIFS